MLALTLSLSAIVLLGADPVTRTWTDTTGQFTVEADLLAFNDTTAVLLKKEPMKKDHHELVSVKIEQLSKEDQEYLKSKEAEDLTKTAANELHTWTLKNGLKVNGRVLGFGRRDVVVQRKMGKIHVNDKLFSDLPGVYQRMVPRIVGQFVMEPIETEDQLMAWATKQKGEPRKFTCEGVLLELENGDQYAIPFFFFSDEDLKLLKPGWDQWLAADQDVKKQEQEQFMAKAEAMAYHRNQQANNQMQQLELGLLATAAGVTDLWQVQMLPPGGAGRPVAVIVPAQNSGQAMIAAKNKYPNYIPGIARKISERRRFR
jgi:hypothetical protein